MNTHLCLVTVGKLGQECTTQIWDTKYCMCLSVVSLCSYAGRVVASSFKAQRENPEMTVRKTDPVLKGAKQRLEQLTQVRRSIANSDSSHTLRLLPTWSSVNIALSWHSIILYAIYVTTGLNFKFNCQLCKVLQMYVNRLITTYFTDLRWYLRSHRFILYILYIEKFKDGPQCGRWYSKWALL